MKAVNKTNVRLKAVITRANGTKEDLGVLFDTRWGFWKKLWYRLRKGR